MKLDRQLVFAIVVIFMMITWAMGMALSYNITTNSGGTQIQKIYEEPLTGQEKANIVRSGLVLIEYVYTPGIDSQQKKATYESFINQFDGLIVLQTYEVQDMNQTIDQMIVPTGDVISLKNVTETQLVDVFCDNTLVQPKECLLRNI